MARVILRLRGGGGGGITREHARHLVLAGATMLRDEIVLQMDPGPPRTGRVYRVPETKVPYQASAPGEPPAIREGIYAASWQVSAVAEDGDRISAMAQSAAKTEDGKHFVGEILEYGTDRGIYLGEIGTAEGMAPRPHIRPAMEIVKARLSNLADGA